MIIALLGIAQAAGPGRTGLAGHDAARIAGHWLITAYQTVIAPRQAPNTCNFHPSCSRFTGAALAARGVVIGSVIGADRLLRCNAWAGAELDRAYVATTGGRLYDPPPGSPDGATMASAFRPPGSAPLHPDCNRPEYRFACWLLDRGEPHRAGIEFVRLSHLASDRAVRVEAGLRAGAAFLEAGDYDLARSAYALIIPAAPDAGRFGIAQAEFGAGRYADCRTALEQLGPGLARERTILEGWALFRERQFPAAAALFRQLDDAELSPLAELDGRALPRRRPAVAGILSALVPGAGQVYAGRLGDGFQSFLVVAGSGFLTWWFASGPERDRTRVKTGIFGATTALFYAGNIYGATAAAQSYNRGQERRYVARADELLSRVRFRALLGTDSRQ